MVKFKVGQIIILKDKFGNKSKVKIISYNPPKGIAKGTIFGEILESDVYEVDGGEVAFKLNKFKVVKTE